MNVDDMTPEQRNRIADVLEVVKKMRHTFPVREVSQETITVYAEMLGDIEPEALQSAVRRLAATSRYFPSIAELREAVAESSISAPGDVAAWESIVAYSLHRPAWFDCEACSGNGYEGGDRDGDVICTTCKGGCRVDATPPAPLHPIVRHALDACGGVYAIRQADNITTVRAQFRDTYRALRTEAVRAIQTGEVPAALPPTEKLAALPAVPMPELRSVDA